MMSLTLSLQPQLDGELLLAPGFASPPNLDYAGYHSYIDENLPPESPYLYGLHPNAEIGFLTTTSENLFRTVLEMQPRDSSGAGASGTTREEKVSGCRSLWTSPTTSLVATLIVTLCVVDTDTCGHILQTTLVNESAKVRQTV